MYVRTIDSRDSVWKRNGTVVLTRASEMIIEHLEEACRLPAPPPPCAEKIYDCPSKPLANNTRLQLIKTSRAGLIVAPPPDLSPKLRPAYLEVLALGVRGMQPFEMMPIQSPYMQIEARERPRAFERRGVGLGWEG